MKITKEQYEALPDSLKAFFKPSGDGYEGNIHSDSDVEKQTSGLKSKNDELLGKLKASSEKVSELEAANHDLTVQATKGNGNAEALENSYKSRIEKIEKEAAARESALSSEINEITAGSAAKSLASKLFGPKADLLLHHVAKRVSSEVNKDGKRFIRVLDEDGNATSSSIDDLAKEFSESDRFRGEIVKQPSSTGVPPISPKPTSPGSQPSVTTSQSMTDRAAQLVQSVGN